MKLVIIAGSGAVGKMTVGQSLMKKTKLRLFHNHMTIEPVLEIFGKWQADTIKSLRQCIFNDFVKTDNEGLIFTVIWAFDMQEDWDDINNLIKLFEDNNATTYIVELVANQDVRLDRNKSENRLLNKASKRDVVASEERIKKEDGKYRLESFDGEIKHKNYIKIDNTNLLPDDVADIIINFMNGK